jgi:hypothetical protein
LSRRIIEAYFSVGAITTMTAVGVIATIVNPLGAGWKAVLCIAVGVIGSVAVYVQTRQALRQTEAVYKNQEQARRDGIIEALVREYVNSRGDVSSQIRAGTELPPKDWLNRRLEELGEPWRV